MNAPTSAEQTVITQSVDRHSSGIISTSAVLLVRRGVVTAGAAVSTAIITRQVTTDTFGIYSAALATFYLAQAFCDMGFGSVLSRELATRPDARPSILKATVRPASVWAVVVGLGFCAIALSTAHGSKMTAMLILAPALCFAGASMTRQWFVVRYDVRRMAFVDTVTTLGQTAGLVAVAFLHGGPAALALVVCVTSIANTIVVAIAAFREAGPADVPRGTTKGIVLMALPIGIPSVLASAYFSVDLVIAGYLLPQSEVAQYAAAAKLLSLITMIPALLMAVALPGYAAIRATAGRVEFGELIGRTWQWLVALALPCCVGLACFATLACRLFFGERYLDAADPLRVLMAAGAVSLLGNLVGTVLVAERRTTLMFIQNTVALAANVSLNLLLLPQVGIMAAAWLTLATDAFTVTCSILTVRKAFSWSTFFSVSRIPVLACLAMAGISFIPVGGDLTRAILALAVFIAIMTIGKGWPFDVSLLRRKLSTKLLRKSSS